MAIDSMTKSDYVLWWKRLDRRKEEQIQRICGKEGQPNAQCMQARGTQIQRIKKSRASNETKKYRRNGHNITSDFIPIICDTFYPSPSTGICITHASTRQPTNMHDDSFFVIFMDQVHLILVQYSTNAQLKNNNPLHLNALCQLNDTTLMPSTWSESNSKVLSFVALSHTPKCQWRWKIKGITVDKVRIEELRWVFEALSLQVASLCGSRNKKNWAHFNFPMQIANNNTCNDLWYCQ